MTSTILPVLSLALFDMRDQSSIAIIDLSAYEVLPVIYSMQITSPGWPTTAVTFTPGTVNVYKCADLGITCGPTDCCPLPDGIYEVIYSLGPFPALSGMTSTSLTKTFIKIDQIKCKYQNAFARVDLDCNCGLDEQKLIKEELYQIDLLINGSVAAANDCNPEASFRFYTKADSLLDKISCKFGLPCSATWSCPQCH